MKFIPRQRLVASPHRRANMSGYIAASTANTLGWRPSTMLSGPSGVDWKTSVAHRDAQHAAARRRHDMRRAGEHRRAVLHDAHARGGDVVALSGLGLAALDLNAQMMPGASYLFHFTYGWLGLKVDPQKLASIIAGDGNFRNPVGAVESSGIQISFTYNGKGSTVGNAGREMQNVANDWLGLNPILFAAAEGGPAAAAPASSGGAATGPASGVYSVSPDGTVILYNDGTVQDLTSGTLFDSNGNPITAGAGQTSAPGQLPTTSPGSWFGSGSGSSSLFSGIGPWLAVGLVGLVVLKDL